MKMDRMPKPNEIYQQEPGMLYKVVTLAKHTQTGEILVVCQALYGKYEVLAAPLGQFVKGTDGERAREMDADRPAKGEERSGMAPFVLVPQILGQVPIEGRSWAEEQKRPPERTQENAPEASMEASSMENSSTENSSMKAMEESREEGGLDPRLLRFLDAETYEEKLDLLIRMHDGITDDLLTTMAVSLDIDLEEGELEERYQTLKNCILTLEKYECNRLR